MIAKCYLTHICNISAAPHSKDKLQRAICTAERDSSCNHPTTGKRLSFMHRLCLWLNSTIQIKKRRGKKHQLTVSPLADTVSSEQLSYQRWCIGCESCLIWQIWCSLERSLVGDLVSVCKSARYRFKHSTFIELEPCFIWKPVNTHSLTNHCNTLLK